LKPDGARASSPAAITEREMDKFVNPVAPVRRTKVFATAIPAAGEDARAP